MGKYASIDELRQAVEDAENVLTLPAWEIRDAYGADRLGAIVRQNVAKELRSKGLGHVHEIPDRAQQNVRLYKLGTPVADIIEAVMSTDGALDDRIKAAAGGDAARTVEKIRELVCDAG